MKLSWIAVPAFALALPLTACGSHDATPSATAASSAAATAAHTTACRVYQLQGGASAADAAAAMRTAVRQSGWVQAEIETPLTMVRAGAAAAGTVPSLADGDFALYAAMVKADDHAAAVFGGGDGSTGPVKDDVDAFATADAAIRKACGIV